MSSEAVSYFVGSLSVASNEVAAVESEREPTKSPATDSEINDNRLVLALAQGDREPLAVLFHRYARRVRNVAYRILRNEQEAEDLVQESFLFVFRNAARFDPALGSASSWIIHIAYHRAFDRRRYLISRHFYDGDELNDSIKALAGTQPTSLLSSLTMQDFLGKELIKRYEQRLSQDQRSVIEQYFFAGHTFDEIAEIMGTSRMNVRSHYYRGLDRLRRYVLPEKFRTQ